MSSMTRLLTLAFFLVVCLFGLNAYAGKSVDWPGFAEGAASLAVIEGEIEVLDLEKSEITLDASGLLESKSLILMLKDDTAYYAGDEKTNITSIRGGTSFEKQDEIISEHLKVGDFVKCNYSIKDGKFWIVRLVLIAQQPEMK